VADISSRKILGHNQQTYLRLKVALSLNLRRQVFIAVCDDVPLRDRLARQLQSDLIQTTPLPLDGTAAGAIAPEYPRLVSLQLDLSNPDPLGQVAQWLAQHPPPRQGKQRRPIPGFQIIGIEHLTRQPAAVQRVFLTHLQAMECGLAALDVPLVFWMPQPWFRLLPQSAREFWRCRTAVFEFVGDPTPRSVERPLAPKSTASPTRVDPAAETVDSAPTVALNSIDLEIEDGVVLTIATSAQPEESEAAESAAVHAPDPAMSTNAQESAINVTPTETVIEAVIETATEAGIESATDDSPERLNADGVRGAVLPSSPVAQSANQLPSAQVSASQPPGPATWLTLTPPAVALGLADPNDIPEESLPRGLDLGQSNPLGDYTMVAVPAVASSQSAEPATDYATPHAAESQGGRVAVATPPAAKIAVPQGDRQALVVLEQIDRLHREQAQPPLLADAYCALGDMYRDRVELGDRTLINLTVAIQAYEQAQQWLPAGAAAVDLLNDLGNLYWMRSRCVETPSEAIVQLQHGITLYQQALTQHHPHPARQMMLHNNLGSAYADLARLQDPGPNLARSAQAYEAAQQFQSLAQDPLGYASTQNNLGTTYWNLAQHQDAVLHLHRAIAAYTEALRGCSPSRDGASYGMIQNNLGTAYWNLSQYESPNAMLALAISAYQIALNYRTAAAMPAAHAATQNNLGTAFWHLVNQPLNDTTLEQEYLHQAIAAYRACLNTVRRLEINTPQPLSFDPFATQTNLALVHHKLATASGINLSPEARVQHLDAALQHHLAALRGWHDKPEWQQSALQNVVLTIRSCYERTGLEGQTRALSQVPGEWLSEVLMRL
jgi:tetratricopeptide (TPR) repeat protein